MTARTVADGPRALRRDAGVLLTFLAAAAMLHFPHYASYVGDITRDFYLHYNWAKEFAENVSGGNPYPRWMFHGRLGLGEPVFVFYAPLYYFAVAAIVTLGTSAWAATQVVAVLATAAFAWFVYRTCRYYVDARLAATVGMVALASPFLVMLNYKFDGIAWATIGYASHGLLMWSLLRPGASRSFVNPWAAVAIGLAVGSHVISALINLVCYSAITLLPSEDAQRWRSRVLRSVASWAATVTLGLGLSAVYLAPALLSLDLIRTDVWDPNVPFTAFSWPLVTQHFYAQRWFSFQWTISLPALTLVLAPLAYTIWNKGTPPILRKAVVIASVAAFFASELSFPIWSIETPLQKIQLPFRFISVAYTFGAVAAGLAIFDAGRTGRKAWRLALWTVLGLSFTTGALSLVKASYLDGPQLPAELRRDEYTFLPFIEVLRRTGACPGVDSGADAACRQRWASSGSFRGTPEYRLDWAGPDYAAYAQRGFLAHCEDRGVRCEAPEQTATGRLWVVTAQAPQVLVLPIFDFPSWTVEVGGARVQHHTDKSTGLIALDVPLGRHEVQVVWRPSATERLGQQVTLASIALLCLSCAWQWRQGRRRPGSVVPGTPAAGTTSRAAGRAEAGNNRSVT